MNKLSFYLGKVKNDFVRRNTSMYFKSFLLFTFTNILFVLNKFLYFNCILYTLILFLVIVLRLNINLNLNQEMLVLVAILTMIHPFTHISNLPFYAKISVSLAFFMIMIPIAVNIYLKINFIRSNIHFLKLKRVSYFLFIFVFFAVLKTTTCMATDEFDDAISLDDYMKGRINAFEYARDKAFQNIDHSEIKKLTEEITKLIATREDISQEDRPPYINSIVKTRHLFPGKILYHSYNLQKKDRKSCLLTPETLSLIALSEVIAYISLTDNDFFTLMEVFLTHRHAENLKKKILSELSDDIENKILTVRILKNIKHLLSDMSLLRQICEIELSYSPIISFSKLYCELMPSAHYQGYDVLTAGINQYNYWPSEEDMQQIIEFTAGDEEEIIEFNEKNIQEKRQLIQKILSENEYAGQFKALSLLAMEITLEAVKAFNVLAGLSGSFIPYLSNCFLNEESHEILLVRDEKSSTPYNHDDYLRIKDRYRKNSINYSIKSIENPNEDIYRHFAEHGVSDAQFKYAETLLRRDFRDEFLIAFSYLNQLSLKGDSNILYHLATMYEARINILSNINESEEEYKKTKEMAREIYEMAALKGDKRAQYILSRLYENSEDLNYKNKAERFLNLARDNGNAETQYELAIQFECGLCSEINKMNEHIAKTSFIFLLCKIIHMQRTFSRV